MISGTFVQGAQSSTTSWRIRTAPTPASRSRGTPRMALNKVLRHRFTKARTSTSSTLALEPWRRLKISKNAHFNIEKIAYSWPFGWRRFLPAEVRKLLRSRREISQSEKNVFAPQGNVSIPIDGLLLRMISSCAVPACYISLGIHYVKYFVFT